MTNSCDCMELLHVSEICDMREQPQCQACFVVGWVRGYDPETAMAKLISAEPSIGRDKVLDLDLSCGSQGIDFNDEMCRIVGRITRKNGKIVLEAQSIHSASGWNYLILDKIIRIQRNVLIDGKDS